MARIEKTVFISYRRTDVYTALAVYQDLSSKGYDVFFDYTHIPSGDFEQIIVSNIRGRAHFLLILTPTALDRCSEPGDWLRREIETAMDAQRNIIPLFFKGFNFGTPSVSEQLTGKLSDLGRYNGLNVHEDYFQAAMNRLSTQFLDVPLDTVLHPISREVRKVVTDEQSAVNDAIAEKWQEIKEFIKPTREKETVSTINEESRGKDKARSFRLYGIGAAILLAVVLGIAGISALLSNNPGTTALTTAPAVINTVAAQPSVTASVGTATAEPGVLESDTPAPAIATATLTVMPSPTLGVGSTMISPNDGMVMVYVPAGPFKMGFQGGDNETDEKPVHTVNLDAFWIDQTEVTNAMYAQCQAIGRCDPPGSLGRDYYGFTEFDNYPVAFISWDNAQRYCVWAERRLPTEAEWEKAARGLDQRVYPWKGNNIDCTLANYYSGERYCFDRKGGPAPVKTYELGKSPYGAYEMAGNVWEWVYDFYDENYYRTLPEESTNPGGPDRANLHVARGGAWDVTAVQLRSSNRAAFDARSYVGFRCAMSASE